MNGRLTAEGKAMMYHVRRILSPRKSAAVAALLLSEQHEKTNEKLRRVEDAIKYLEFERAQLIELETENNQ